VAGSSVVLGGSFNLTATAADSDGTVAKVEFFANGAPVGQALGAPYALTWTPGAVGSYALTAVATDNAGGTATSSALNVNVTAPNALPTVSMTGPVAGSSVVLGGSFNLTATATDSDGTVAKVQFFANGAPVGQALSAPYALTWTPGAVGSYALTAVATDNAGGTATSSSVNVSVTPGSGGTLTATLQRGLGAYAGVTDTYLSSYHQTFSWGAAATLNFSATNYVPLIRFAIFAAEGGPVPAGAIIQSARLEVYKQYYDYAFRLNAMLKPWGEGQATWIRSQAGVAWTNAGAGGVGTDHSATVDATGSGGFNPGWVAFDVTGRVQQWAGAVGTNFGWRIGPVGGDNNDKVFYSSEYLTDPTLRPKLTVVYK
jgi:Bacterial Ig domain